MHKLQIFVWSCLLSTTIGFSQENITYQKPPKEILDLVDFERAPGVLMDSKKENIVFTYRDTYKSLEDLSKEEVKLAGLRIDPTANISSQITYITNLKVRKFNGKELIQVTGLPANPRIAFLSWSPNEQKMAFTNTAATGLELWVLDVQSGKATQLKVEKLNANLGMPYIWLKNSESLLVRVVPQNQPAYMDPSKVIPTGPTVTNSTGSKAQNRTYQDLLKNKIDEANFENLVTSELYVVKLTGEKQLWKSKNLYAGESLSPDGNYVLSTVLEKPFSYLVPYNRFPMASSVYELNGTLVREVNKIQLSEVLPKGFMAVRTGKRAMSWRLDQPATLYFVEALDEGNPEKSVPFRDEIFTWKAPFSGQPISLFKTVQRFEDISWGNENWAVVTDSWWNTRNTKTYAINPSNPNQQALVLFDRSSQDIYSNPGEFEMKRNVYGKMTLDIQGSTVYLIGEGHTPKGQFPFIDQLDLRTQKKTRMYQSALTDKLEELITFVDDSKSTVLIRLQSQTSYPNYYVRTLKSKKEPVALTAFENPFKSIANVYKEVLKYKRADGVELTATLYLPLGYDTKKKEKLPMIMWAYPQEFKDKNAAGQSATNPNEFIFPYYGSPIYWATRGYVVLDDAAFPIVGEGTEEPNDSFIAQLKMNAEAAINAVDSLGYIDRTRVAVGGHSYGAFMTANLLTHTNLFACGVARSGAYNRTLTPFGFQSEERNYWEVPEVYNTMSPFMTANQMKTPLLLIHGEADNNPGTFTLQSERYFNALKGLGNPARLVILPKESHGYAAKISILHVLWEQDQWFEKYLKNAKP